jgi:outer membrane protein assembly factor BamD
MRFPPLPALRVLVVAAASALLLAPAARADLVWSPSTGWRIQGGVLSGLTGPEGRNALEMMNTARSDQERGRIHSALHIYTKVAKRYPSSVYAPEALYQVGKIRFARRQYYKAFDAYQSIVARYPNEHRFDEIIGEEYRIASLLLDGARNYMWGFIPGFRNRERAVAYFEAVVANAPYGEYAPLALMSAARGYEYMHDPDEAIDILDRVVNNYQQSVLVPFGYLELAKEHASQVQGAYYDQGETNQAITYYEDFMILFPNDPQIAVAAEGLDRMKRILADSKILEGDFYFYHRDNYTAARVFYNEAITSYPDSPIARQAKLKLADVAAKAAGKPEPYGRKRKKHFLFF